MKNTIDVKNGLKLKTHSHANVNYIQGSKLRILELQLTLMYASKL